jgi:uncharacterized membrane protein YphA (DoxX/SURF4 family)
MNPTTVLQCTPMLSIFPELLFLAPFSAFVIRVSVACLFALAAYTHVRPIRDAQNISSGSNGAGTSLTTLTYIIAFLEILAAISLAIGYYAQIGALVGVFVVGVWFIIKNVRPYQSSTIFLLFILCLSLLVTGPGALAFDLPL